jgi:multidrug transporter EmrE-like cation transporter
MIGDKMIYISIFLLGIFVSSVSQLMLKTSANELHQNFVKEYLNAKVIFAYILFVGATFCSIYAYRGIPLSWGPILESSGYIFVSILSVFILKESISRKKVIGLSIIICGIIVYAQ